MVSSQTILTNIHPWNIIFPSLYNVHNDHTVHFLHDLSILLLLILNKRLIGISIIYYLFSTPKIASLNFETHSYTVLYYLLFLALCHTLHSIQFLVQSHALSFALSFLYFPSSLVLLSISIHSKISMVSFYISFHLVQILSSNLCNY